MDRGVARASVLVKKWNNYKAKMQYEIKRPCRECPFRKASLPGWLGSDTPQEVVDHVLGRQEIEPGLIVGGEPQDYACHMDVDRVMDREGYETDDEIQDDEVSHCAGALHFLKTSCKAPKDHEKSKAIDAVVATEPMLLNYHEFLKHHTRT
jgi:hypothetical protein